METKDRQEPGSATTSNSDSPNDLSQQTKNNVLELSFKTRRHFVFCSAATSPRRIPILGLGQGLWGAGLKMESSQDVLVSSNAALPISSTTMFLEDHDYSSTSKRGFETGTHLVLPPPTMSNADGVSYNGLNDSNASHVSSQPLLTESLGDEMEATHLNQMSDFMQAMCEEVVQVESDVAAGLGDTMNGGPYADAQGICDLKNCDSHSGSKTTEGLTYLAPSAFAVKVQKPDFHKDGRAAVGVESVSSSTPAARNHIVRASWSSPPSTNKQNSVTKANRCANATYPDCDSTTPHGAKAGPSSSKYQLFKVDMSGNSTTPTGLSTFCDDQSPFLSDRTASGSLDSAQTGMILPSPFLIQTGLEKTLDFAEFHPMSPSNKDWDDEFCCPYENDGPDVALFAQEVARTCEVSGVSAFDGQDFSAAHQNLFSSPPPATTNCVRLQHNLYASSDDKPTSVRSKPGSSKWLGKRQEHLKVTFDPYTLEDLQVRRRKPVKRQLDFGSAVEMSEESVFDLDRKRARHTLPFNRDAHEKRELTGNDLGLNRSADSLKARRPRKPKKLRDLGKSGKDMFDQKPRIFELMDNRPCKKFRLKSEASSVDQKYGDTKGNASLDRFNDPTKGKAVEQERPPPRRTGPSDAAPVPVSQQKVPPALRSVDFCNVLTTMVDRWQAYLMTSSDVMRQQAAEDARSFGYNEDALQMVSNGDLEVWRILEDMEPDFVRSGIEKYFV